MLHLFHIAARKPVGYDSYDSFVVAATDKIAARAFCAEVAGDEGEGTWLSNSHSSCETIGTAYPDHQPGIVVSSFNAG